MEGSELFLVGRLVLQHYNDLRDVGYYLSAEHIVDVLCMPEPAGDSFVCALACQDRVLRVVRVRPP